MRHSTLCVAFATSPILDCRYWLKTRLDLMCESSTNDLNAASLTDFAWIWLELLCALRWHPVHMPWPGGFMG